MIQCRGQSWTTPESSLCEVRVFVGCDVLRVRERGLEEVLVQDRISRLREWGLGRLGVRSQGCLAVGVLDGQRTTAGRIGRVAAARRACHARQT